VKNISKLMLVIMILIFVLTGCMGTETPGEKGQEIINAKKALKSLSGENVVLVDVQNSSAYKNGHIEGAVNINRNNITTFSPFPNMLASAEQVEKVLGKNGISNDTTIIIYDDNNNMDAARLWWTLKVYGHKNVKVVSGGLKAMLRAGADISTIIPDLKTVTYEITVKNEEIIATREDVETVVNNPQDDVILLDVRTEKEYSEGTIPGSILLDYIVNNYDDGTFRPVRQIHTLYRDKGITPEKTVIMYCKTSIRGAQTYLALYNAGYRKLMIYDGAWIEWSADSSLPVQTPDGTQIQPNFQDAS
jgi:thiosulfate/3-mercaptopyruvate sulfurtransferase